MAHDIFSVANNPPKALREDKQSLSILEKNKEVAIDTIIQALKNEDFSEAHDIINQFYSRPIADFVEYLCQLHSGQTNTSKN